MTKRTLTRWSTAFLSLALIVPAAGAAPVAAQSEDGGTLIAAWVGPCCNGADWITPWDGGGDAHFFNKIYSRLTTYEVDQEAGTYGKLIGDLATEWTISEDQLTWTFKLRDGVTWHDGTPFTANDVAFSFDLAVNPDKNMPAAYSAPLQTLVGAAEVAASDATDGKLEHISGLKVVDDLTLELTFTAPNALFPDGISELFILPQHAVGALDPLTLKENPYWASSQIGTGPFMWKEYKAGESVELVRNDSYFLGAPKLAGIIRREFKDPGAALLAFDSGEIHFTYVTADEVGRYSDSADATVFAGPSGVDNVLQCNPVLVPACANADFRKAMLAAIDKQSIIDNIYGGAAQAVSCLYGRANLVGDVVGQGFDAQAAKDLLASSGVDIASVGELTLDTYYNDPLSLNVMTAIQAMWKDNLGLNVKIEQLDGPAWTDRYYKQGASQLSFFGAANGPTGERARNYFHSKSAHPAGNNGWNGPTSVWAFSNPDLDALLDTGVTLFDQAEQDANYQQACQLMADELPWLFLWQSVRYHVVSNRLQNVILIPAAGGGSYYDAVETWTLSE